MPSLSRCGMLLGSAGLTPAAAGNSCATFMRTPDTDPPAESSIDDDDVAGIGIASSHVPDLRPLRHPGVLAGFPMTELTGAGRAACPASLAGFHRRHLRPTVSGTAHAMCGGQESEGS